MKMPGPISLIKKATNLYFKKPNLLYFLKPALVNVVIVFVVGFLFGFSDIFNKAGEVNINVFKQLDPLTIASMVLLGIFMLIWGMWFNIIQIQASSNVVKGLTGGLKELMQSSWKRLWKYFLAISLTLLIIFGGMMLLVVPGIIFSIWFVFVSLIISLEDVKVKDALAKSKELIKGKVQAVFGRMFVFALLAFVVQLILRFVPYVGQLVFLAISPFFAFLGYLLYSEVKAQPQPQE